MIYPLDCPKNFFNAILSTIDQATKDDELILNYFVVREDHAGVSLLARLYMALTRDVQVHLIVDDYGSMHPSSEGTEYDSKPLSNPLLELLVSKGAQVYLYHPIKSTSLYAASNVLNWPWFSRRDHSKIFAFNLKSSGKSGVVLGDSQWADEHFSPKFRGNNSYVLNADLFSEVKGYCTTLISSKHVTQIKGNKTGQTSNIEKELIGHFLDTAVNHYWMMKLPMFEAQSVQFVANEIEFENPKSRKTIQHTEMELLTNAQHFACYTTPYFGPDAELMQAFTNCHKKIGNNFNLLIAKFKDHPYLPYGTKKAAMNLLRFNLPIFEYQGSGNIHYKDLIVDDMSFIKSSNGEGRSRFFNLESGLLIKSHEYANYNRLHFLADLRKAEKLHLKTKFITEKKWLKRLLKEAMNPFYYHHL